MSILSAVASMLESAAAGLRRADERPVSAAIAAPLRAVRTRIAPEPHPIGFWRCTHSTFSEFKPGHAYHCRRMSHTSCIRILPYEGSSWSPYWQHHDERFCYPDKDLRFVYLGPTLPEGETLDVRTQEQRKQDRIEMRRMAQAA